MLRYGQLSQTNDIGETEALADSITLVLDTTHAHGNGSLIYRNFTFTPQPQA